MWSHSLQLATGPSLVDIQLVLSVGEPSHHQLSCILPRGWSQFRRSQPPTINPGLGHDGCRVNTVTTSRTGRQSPNIFCGKRNRATLCPRGGTSLCHLDYSVTRAYQWLCRFSSSHGKLGSFIALLLWGAMLNKTSCEATTTARRTTSAGSGSPMWILMKIAAESTT